MKNKEAKEVVPRNYHQPVKPLLRAQRLMNRGLTEAFWGHVYGKGFSGRSSELRRAELQDLFGPQASPSLVLEYC